MADDITPRVEIDAASAGQDVQPLATIIDASVLIPLMRQMQLSRGQENQFNPLTFLERFSEPPRTLVIPATALLEVFRDEGKKKSYGFYYNKKTGKMGFNIPSAAKRDAGARALARFLNQFARENKLSYYPSEEAMLQSTGLERTKGGLFIVDSADREVPSMNAKGEYSMLPPDSQTADKAIESLVFEAYDLAKHGRTSNKGMIVLSNDWGILNFCERYMAGVSENEKIYGANTQSILKVAVDRGWITQEQFDATSTKAKGMRRISKQHDYVAEKLAEKLAASELPRDKHVELLGRT